MNKIFKWASIITFSALCFVFANPSVADAWTCTDTWGGKTWTYDVFRPAGLPYYSTGSFTFNNWANTGFDITINSQGNLGYCMTHEEFVISMNWSYNSDAQTFWNQNTNYWSRSLSCGNTHTYEKTSTVDDAVCGSAAGGLYPSAPTTNLCSVGTPSTAREYVGYANQYRWTCTGSGGLNKWCSATKVTPPVVNGACGSDNNSCNAGNLYDINDSAQRYQWICLGSGGGTDSPTCTAPKNGNGNNNNNNNNNNSDNPVCQISPTSITSVGGPSMTWSISGLINPQSYKYDWLSADSLVNSNTSYSYTIPTSAHKILSDVRVGITKNQGNDDAEVVPCPDAVVADIPLLNIDEPIVEEGTQCLLSWGELDSNASCEIRSQYGGTSGSIGENDDMLVSPTDPNNKYFIRCAFYADGVLINTIDSNKKSCIKTGTLIEI